MITGPELRALLDGLARKFDSRPLSEHTVRDGEAQGWGQFLDSQPEHNQIGPFGTCSGVITRALAKRGSDRLYHRVNLLLKHWWEERRSPQSHARFLGQTIRLSMLHLALRIQNSSDTATMAKEVADGLLEAIRPDEMWGNYVMPREQEDASPRVVATSLAVLSFTLFRSGEEGPPPTKVLTAIGHLEDRLLGSEDLPRLHVAIALAAILSTPLHKPDKEVLKRIQAIAYSTQVSLPDLGVYFYDYEFSEGTLVKNPPSKEDTAPLEEGDVKSDEIDGGLGKQTSKTDYFIVPTELLLGIAGYMPQAPLILRLRAEATVKLLVRNLRGYDGYYRPDPEQRLSSVNQCWVAMYLALAEEVLRKPDTSDLPVWKRPIASITYGLLKQRPDNIWLDTAILSLSVMAVSVSNWSIPLDSELQSITVRVLTVVLGFIAGRLYAPSVVKRIFVERP